MTKKGQSSSGAAILVALIALLLILYILFIPPSERAKLFGKSYTPGSTTANDTSNFLSVSPGQQYQNDESMFLYTIPAFTLYKTTNAQTIERQNDFIVSNSWGGKVTKNMTFALTDLANTDNILMTFKLEKPAKGELMIKLNGEIIYNKQIDSLSPDPIYLSKDILQQKNNLEFSVSTVGFAFWRKNLYSITDLIIVADVTDISRQKAENTFAIPKNKLGVEKATLRYTPQCSQMNVGNLVILINGYKIASATPYCGALNSNTFTPSILSDSNYVAFISTEGTYIINNIKIETYMPESGFPTYYFDISKTDYDKIKTHKINSTLQIKFTNNNQFKQGIVDLNGHEIGVSTNALTFSKNVDSYLEEGNNYLRIQPDEKWDVTSLKITK